MPARAAAAASLKQQAREAKAKRRTDERRARNTQQQHNSTGATNSSSKPAARAAKRTNRDADDDEEKSDGSDEEMRSPSEDDEEEDEEASASGSASASGDDEVEEEEAEEANGSDSDASVSEQDDDDDESASPGDSGSSDSDSAHEERKQASRKRAPVRKRAVPSSTASSKAVSRKRPHAAAAESEDDDGEAEEKADEERHARAAPASAASATSAASAAAAAVSEPKKSRNSGRVVRKPSAPDDSSSSDDDAAAAAASRRKRPRLNGTTSSSASSHPLDPDELADEWRCSANDALTFRLVRPAPEKESSKAAAERENAQFDYLNFHPAYTHQLWDDEEIVGYKKVKALVAFTSGALYTYLNVEYESKCPDTDVADIQTLIGSKLRGGFTTDWEDFKRHVHDPFVPPGTLLSEYSLPSVDHSGKDVITYEVRHGHFSDATLRAYHARIQFFLLFFIDRSSFINDADPVWELLLIFQKRVSPPSRNNGALAAAGPTTTYHCVGYTTLYKFLSYPDDWKMRLSQILILPPYQRAGHGQKLLQLVYSLAEQRRAIEVNIEDPSPVFQLLRDLTDVNLCRKHRFFEKQPAAAAAASSDGESAAPEDPLDHWDVAYARRVKACLRLTMGQVRRCYEIFKLALQVNDRHNKTSKAMTAYRLEVKARLFKQEQEVLSLYSHKPEERKEKLAEMYNELEAHYLTVIKKARLH